jgi:hypothetical protein
MPASVLATCWWLVGCEWLVIVGVHPWASMMIHVCPPLLLLRVRCKCTCQHALDRTPTSSARESTPSIALKYSGEAERCSPTGGPGDRGGVERGAGRKCLTLAFMHRKAPHAPSQPPAVLPLALLDIHCIARRGATAPSYRMHWLRTTCAPPPPTPLPHSAGCICLWATTAAPPRLLCLELQ